MNTELLQTETAIDRPSGMRRRMRQQNIAAGGIVLLTGAILSTAYLTWLKPITPYAVYATMLLLGMGMFFFITDRTRLMFTSLLCCGALSLFLKSSANQRLRLGGEAEPVIRLAHVNLSNAEGDYDTVIQYLLGTSANLLSVQELTPDWENLLADRLRDRFPYQSTFTRLDPYGSGLYSTTPFERVDTIWFGDIPSLVGTLDRGMRRPCHVITAQVVPPVNQAAYATIAEHLQLIARIVKTLPGHVILAGDFHLPPWSAEVSQLKSAAGLVDSRRDVHTRNLDGSVSLPRIPVDHLLYDQTLDCASFSTIGNDAVGRLGMLGAYYPNPHHAKVAE